MAKIRALKKYDISKHRFAELYHFCLQYHDWKAELECCLVNNSKTENPFEILQKRCRLIENTAKAVDETLYQYIIEGATTEGISFNQLKSNMNIPCKRNVYYDCKQRFFWLLSQQDLSEELL